LAALLIHRAGRKLGIVVLTLLPILVLGMLDNQRRMVWVQILAVLAAIFLISGMTPVKRKIIRAMLVSSPFLLLYVMLGWNRSTGFFKPVSTIRSAVDSDVDASTMWRDVENFDLVWTLRQNPIFGTGYGHPFIEFIPLPPIDYMLELYIPHNSILGLWAYCGYVGYTGITLLWVAGVFFAVRAYHAASAPMDKAAALASFGAILIYYLQCYGDMGLGSWSGVFMVGTAIAVGGKLAVSTGAWGQPQKVTQLPSISVAPRNEPRARAMP